MALVDPDPDQGLDKLLASLHYAYPTAIFLMFGVSSAVSIFKLQTTAPQDKHPHQSRLSWLMLFCVLTYLVQLMALVAHCMEARRFPLHHDTVIGLLSCILVFGVQVASLKDTEKPVWYPYIGPYVAALALEPLLAALSFAARRPHAFGYFEVVTLGSIGVRELLMALVVTLYFVGRRSVGRSGQAETECEDAERQPLLQEDGARNGGGGVGTAGYGSTATTAPDGTGAGTGTGTGGGEAGGDGSADSKKATQNGATRQNTKDTKDAKGAKDSKDAESPWERRQRKASEQMEKRLRENGNWFTYVKSFAIFVPYIWPVHNRGLQVRAVLVGVCLLVNNGLNVLIPRQMGLLTDSLSGANGENPWKQVVIFAALKLTASEAGLSLLRQWLWIPVEFYSFGAMSTAAYSHVLNLSSDFHDTKSSSDIMVAIQSGQSVSNLLDSICFHAVPMLVDMAFAFVYLSATFGAYEGLVTVATAMVFLHIATRLIYSLKEARKREVSAYFEEHYIRQAGIQGWSTVACFNQVAYEEERYARAVRDRVAKSQAVYVGYLVAYAFQYLVLLAGLLAGAFLAVYQVTSGQATPGQFIMLLTYWAQLVAPLNFFAGLGKTVSRNLIGAEQLLEIMRTKPTVVSGKDAPPLEFAGGNVGFDGVCFSYDGKKQILEDLNFSVAQGDTVAFVGATGAGKSTILKLLSRFYDVSDGSITIDGQDIRHVDLTSLRSQIGIVPQTPVLFDDTVMNNVRYARLSATDEEVFGACKAACIHDQILGFSDGYSSRVGERGIKLSGGELQRLAIARAILKQPAIVLLDEATSSVDTETEQKIQEALGTLCAGRTTFIVAHRLSTVMNAHTIMVVSGGRIVEKGGHEELLRSGGKYADLWSKQVFAKAKPRMLSEPSSEPLSSSDETAATTTGSMDLDSSNTGGLSDSSEDSGDGRGIAIEQTQLQADTTEQTTAQTPSGHKRECSKLNPDAPTFTPRTYAAAVAAAEASGELLEDTVATKNHKDAQRDNNDGHDSDDDSHDHYHDDDDGDGDEAADTPTQRRATSNGGRLGAGATSHGYGPIGATQDDDAQVALLGGDGGDGGRGEVRQNSAKNNSSKKRYPRFSRRVQSKSE